MSSRPVVVGKVRGQDATEMVFIDDDDVVETLASYRAHKPLDVGILPRGSGCSGDGLDAKSLNTAPKVITVDTIAVSDHVLGRRVLGERLNDLLGGPPRAWVAGDVPVQNTPVVVGQDQEDIEGGMKRETLRSPTSMPSLSNSPWILGAPQNGLAMAIWRMSVLVSGETSFCAGVRGCDFQRQKRRKPARCQRATVSGLTMTSTSAQRDHRRERTSQKARSAMRMRGRPDVRRRLASCWRRARFSSTNPARVRRAERSAPRRLMHRPVMA
jgi:hypothetical protein